MRYTASWFRGSAGINQFRFDVRCEWRASLSSVSSEAWLFFAHGVRTWFFHRYFVSRCSRLWEDFLSIKMHFGFCWVAGDVRVSLRLSVRLSRILPIIFPSMNLEILLTSIAEIYWLMTHDVPYKARRSGRWSLSNNLQKCRLLDLPITGYPFCWLSDLSNVSSKGNNSKMLSIAVRVCHLWLS